LRTRTSKTFTGSGRQLTTLIYSESVNFRDPSGAWQAIDDSLVKTSLAGYSYQNKANQYTIYLPSDIGSAPVRVQIGSSWFTFSLAGAKGPARLSGPVANYANVLPGVSVVIAAQADAVEESLVLRSPSAGSVFTYSVQTSAGLTVAARGGGLAILDASGRLVFTFAAPAMFDSSKLHEGRSSAIALTASNAPDGTTVTLKADQGWLGSSARKWPVTIDPTVIVGDVQDCYIAGASPTTSFCGGTSLNAGFDGTNASRALLQFNLRAIPTTNAVVSAKLQLFLGSVSTSTATSLAAYQLTRTWTTGATWNTNDGTSSWTTPGGDFSGTAAATTNGIAASGVWYSWSPTALVQGWVDGTIANDGLIVKEPTENVNNVLSFNSATASNPPYLQVVHQQGGASPGTYSSTVQADSPVAYWHMDETSGSTMTDAENADSGTYQGGFTLAQTPLIQPASGKSVSFNGSTGYATAPTLTALQGDNTRSVELWFQTSYNGGEPLFDSGTSGSNYQSFALHVTGPNTVGGNPALNTPGLILHLWNEDIYLPDLYLANGKRHHVVVTLTANTLWLYVDNTTPGGFIYLPTGWSTTYLLAQPFNLPNTPNTTGNPILIGDTVATLGIGSQFFNGQFDEVAVYSSALSPTQVQNHWQAGNGLPWLPTGVTASTGTNQATVSWSAPTFNGGGITGYVVTPQVGGTERTPITFNSTATSQTITNLSGGTAYTFSVTAINSLGAGIPSAVSASATPSGGAIPIYEDTVLGDSPVGFWPLGETSGTVASDLSEFADGQYVGPVTLGDAGPVINPSSSHATNFSGTNAYVRLNHTTLIEPGAVSVEAWIKLASVPASNQMLVVSPQPGNSPGSNFGYELWINGGSGSVTFGLTTGTATSTAALPIGTWTYVAGTSDGSVIRLYVNGVKQSTTTAAATNYGGSPNFDALITRVGFPGDLADVGIYSAALTAAQVAAHYAAAGYTPGPVSNLVAASSTNSASLTWTAPTYVGTSAIKSYTVTPVVDGKASTSIIVNGAGTGANIPNLAGGASYTFQVAASNASGLGVVVTSSAVTIGSPSSSPGGFGQYLFLRDAGVGQAFSHYGFVSRINVPARATWTIEGRFWGLANTSTTGAHMAWGYLSGTISNPSDQAPVAGLYFDLSGGKAYFEWPGGSCQVPAPSGIPTALTQTTPAHVAISYDGSTVRAFINGILATDINNQPCSQTTGAAAVAAGPFGFMDNSGLKTGYFDEFRVSSVARYTSNFTVPNVRFASDGNTDVLWHFDDYGITKLPTITIPSDAALNSVPSTYRDGSGNINHANTVYWSDHDCCGEVDTKQAYSLGQGVTADELTGGESKWLCPCTISSTARPVNDATGEFYHTFTDFHIPGRIDLDLSHTYSSSRATTLGPSPQPIGYGWTDNYNEYISFSGPSGSGDATVHESNGSAVLFPFDAVHSTYNGPPSEHVILAKSGSLFDLTDAGQNQEVFNAPDTNNISWLHQLIDRHNSAAYTLTLAYSGGNLTTVTDPSGRTLTFAYATITGYRTVTVSDSGSPVRSVVFQIGNDPGQPATFNNLTQVTDVAGGLTKFTYVNYGGGQYLQTLTDPNNGVTTNTYDPTSHMITSQQDPITSRTTAFSYSGGTTTITDPKGNVTKEEYINGILLSRSSLDANGNAIAVWTYSFDPAAIGLTASVGPSGETVTTTRDANSNVLSETDGLGRTTINTYNSFSQPVTIQDPGGNCNATPAILCTTNAYNGTGDLTSTSRPLVGTSQVQTVTYNHTDSSHPGDVTSMVDADNFTWTYTYDSNGYRNSITDPVGDKTTYVYNADGWMTSSTTPNGYLTRQDTFSRTPVTGSWGTATDGNAWTKQVGSATYSTTGTQGKIASPSSDSFESLGPAIANDGGEVLVRWQVAATTNKAGAVLRMSAAAATYYGVRFDGAGHVELFGKWGGTVHTNIGSVRVSYTPGTALQWFRFRVAGNTLYFKVWADGTTEPANWSGTTTDANVTGTGFAGLFGNASNSTGVKFDQFSANPNATTTYTYNNFGQRTGLTDPENHTTTWHYDPNQNLDRITDADNNITTNVYDADNELTQVKRADSPQTTLTTDYNLDGTVLDQKDGKGNAIQSYQYDSLAHVTTVTDALGNVTTYVYDAYGDILSKQDPGGNCGAVPATACTTYSYDAANQLTGINYSDGVTPNVSRITYDGDGQRLGMTDGTGTSSWGWDSLHRMVSYQNGNAVQVQWQYNLRNLPIKIIYPGSLNVVPGYDNAGRWTSVQDWNSNITNFGYDADSNLTTETFPSASTVVDTFTFNAADQMTAVASVKGGSTTLFSAGYTRDSANQLGSDTSAASGTGSYKYTPLNQACYAGSSNSNACSSPPSGSIPYTYDAADNLSQKGTIYQAFNNADQLCWTASSSAACGSPPSGKTTYTYDTRGNRTAATPTTGQAQALTYDQANRLTKYAAASTTSYGYNGDGLRMCKYAGSSNQPCQATGNTAYMWNVAGSLPLLLKDGSTAYVYGPGGLPLEQVNTGVTYWYHHDQLGSTRLVTNSSGAIAATYTFDPYGGLAASTNPGGITNPFGFCAQYQDSESGVYYLRARYYDPATAQFVAADPATGTTRTPYSYSLNNPLNGQDPTGLCWPSWACGAENAVGSALRVAGRALITYPVADLKSALYNVESAVGAFPYALYKGAYEFNKRFPNFPIPVVNGYECLAQQFGLHGDEAWDRFQNWTGYPDANEGDEGMRVSAFPSVFVPLAFDSDGTCHPRKLYETGITIYAPGKHGNGHEDFAGC
jgi:RHS repeat-associated protein